jgi:NAD(P)-dependent dehydrogenase (short-subunit alcohol dehydrogenase family)
MNAFVTGAGKGLGLSFARVLLSKGYRVVAGYLGSRDSLDALPGDGRLFPVSLDVSSEGINNAGVFPPDSDAGIETLDFGGFHGCFDVNSLGPLRVIREFLPLLERGEMKTLVTVSSEAGSIGACERRDTYAYCMSKAALNMAMRIAFNALSPKGYSVLIVHPGWLQTDMGRAGGREPPVPPDTSAADIVGLAETRREELSGRLVDHEGVPMPW